MLHSLNSLYPMSFPHFICLISVDPSLGRVGKLSLSQQTLMELLIEGITNAESIRSSNDEPTDISEWEGIVFNDSREVTRILWQVRQLSGSMDIRWLPPTTEKLALTFNELMGTVDFTTLPVNLSTICLGVNKFHGTADLTNLPRVIRSLNLGKNRFEGTLDLTKLPDNLESLRLYRNNFSGSTDFSQLPKSLKAINVSGTLLEGEISESIGQLGTDNSKVKVVRKRLSEIIPQKNQVNNFED